MKTLKLIGLFLFAFFLSMNVSAAEYGPYSTYGNVLGTVLDTQISIYGSAYDVRNGFDAAFRNGIKSGIVVTDEGGLNISWTAGVAFVAGSLFDVNLAGVTALTDNATNYLYALKDNTTLQIATTEPTGEYALRAIIYTYSADIHHMFNFPNMSGGLRERIWKFAKDVLPTAVVSGCACSIDTDATNANDFKIGTGSYFTNALDEQTIASIIYSAGADHISNNVEAYYHVAGAWTIGAENGINFTQWDNGTDKTVTAANKWYCGFIFVEGTTTPIYVYPQTEHSSEADAVAEVIVYPPYHDGFVLPVARFIFRHGETAFSTRAYFVDIRPFFGTGGGTASVQNIYQTVIGDTGSTTATTSDDTLDIEGGTGITTAVTADKVTVNVNGVLEDLNTLGVAASDGQFIVATGAGVFAYESGATARASLVAASEVTLAQKQQQLTDGVNISWNMSSGGYAYVTLAGNRTLDNPTNVAAGGLYRLRITQDATGTRTLAYGTNFKFPGGTAPTLSTGVDAVDLLEFIAHDSTTLYLTNTVLNLQ